MNDSQTKFLQWWQRYRYTTGGALVVLVGILGVLLTRIPSAISVDQSYQDLIARMNLASAELKVRREGVVDRKMVISDYANLYFIWNMVRSHDLVEILPKNHENIYCTIRLVQKSGESYLLHVTAIPSSQVVNFTFSNGRGGILQLAYIDTEKRFLSLIENHK